MHSFSNEVERFTCASAATASTIQKLDPCFASSAITALTFPSLGFPLIPLSIFFPLDKVLEGLVYFHDKSHGPMVCNYPFTTRGILMGHIVLDLERFQVTDTPGLLRRHDDDRNNLEKLTLAVLEHLPTAILYVHDLTGECGISPADQFIIYKDIKGRFGDHLWLDVVSKSDLMQEPIDGILKEEDDDDDISRYRKFGPDDAIWVSVKTEAGISKLKSRVKDLLTSQMARIRSGNCNHAECGS